MVSCLESRTDNGDANTNGNSRIKGFFSRFLRSFGLVRLTTGSNGKYKKDSEENERSRFVESVRKRYNIREDRLAKLLEVVEYQYSFANGLQTREGILQEEVEFSREYREFQEYLRQHSGNFVAGTIVDRVNSIYRENQGKKSVARIFRELKTRERFRISFRYNEKLNRYEIGTDNNATDIRDLPDHGLKRTLAFMKQGACFRDYLKGELDRPTINCVKKDIMLGFNYCTIRDVNELRQFGLNINYQGVDSVIEERYDIPRANPYRSRGPTYSSGRNGQKRTRSLELVGV